MKIITIVNVTTKVVMVMLIFVIVKKQEDAFLVPIIYSFGYFVGGFISLYLIVFKMKIKLVCPNLKSSLIETCFAQTKFEPKSIKREA